MADTVASLLREAVTFHEAGRLEAAEPLYGAVLEHDSSNADAWHLLGRIALARGQWQSAAARVIQAIRLSPSIAAFHSTLGETLAADGRIADAKMCYQEALRLDAGFVPALINLGDALRLEGNYNDACMAYGRAIQAQPGCAAAFNNLGQTFLAQGRREEAALCYQEALRLEPAKPEAAVNLAAAALEMGNWEEAEQWARRALEISPRLAAGMSNLSVALLNQSRFEEAEQIARAAIAASPGAAHLHSNLGSVLLQQKRFDEAAEACRQALALRPDYIEAMTNLGVALGWQDRLEEAAELCERVLRSRPEIADVWTNLGTVRQRQARHEDALIAFEEAITRSPGHAKAHFCHALSLLTKGRLVEGFAEYEWRWRILGQAAEGLPRAWRRPAWDGKPIDGRTILLFAEQGLGDTIHFERFIPQVAAMGGHVIVECQAKLAPLIAGLPGVGAVVTPADDLPEFDVQAALMSLPHLLGTTLETIPGEAPYFRVPPSALKPGAGKLRVGIAWAGNPAHSTDRLRSIPAAALVPLYRIPGIDWYSLHDEAGGIPELAVLMAGLDLVISVDTMAAHLAGALGRPVWTLLSRAADWRWLEDREDTPWYPTMRLFRQEVSGDWDRVVERVARELLNLLGCEPMSIDETRKGPAGSGGGRRQDAAET